MVSNSNVPTFQEFLECIKGTGVTEESWSLGRAPYLHRILSPLLPLKDQMQGPTLDVASGGASFFRPISCFAPWLLPYATTELHSGAVTIDGTTIPAHAFECERDRLPLPDRSQGLVLFCDVIEHLLVDPVWTLLEFNRVLREGAHLVISTPNVTGIDRVINVLKGRNPINESQYKPTALHQRHNREWAVRELQSILELVGFGELVYTTHPELISGTLTDLHRLMTSAGYTDIPLGDFGPEIVIIGRKVEHLTVDSPLDVDRRWPKWLYTDIDDYRQRPTIYPIVNS